MSKNKKRRAAMTPKSANAGLPGKALMLGLAIIAGSTASALIYFGSSSTANAGTITVWKSNTCGCCAGWVAYMRDKGYRVTVNNVVDPVPIKIKLGIPDPLHSCHTAKVGNYIVEGHVPVAAVAKLLEQRPELKGIALPGMPAGSPGMNGTPGIYRILGFSPDGNTYGFAAVGI